MMGNPRSPRPLGANLWRGGRRHPPTVASLVRARGRAARARTEAPARGRALARAHDARFPVGGQRPRRARTDRPRDDVWVHSIGADNRAPRSDGGAPDRAGRGPSRGIRRAPGSRASADAHPVAGRVSRAIYARPMSYASDTAALVALLRAAKDPVANYSDLVEDAGSATTILDDEQGLLGRRAESGSSASSTRAIPRTFAPSTIAPRSFLLPASSSRATRDRSP